MKFISLSLIIFLTGCASMFNGSQQDLTVKTHKQAEIFINDRFVGKGYATRQVQRDEPHTVKVVLGDCSQTFTTRAEFNKTTLLGLLMDVGLFSIPTDFATGAAWNVYPDKIKILPTCGDSEN